MSGTFTLSTMIGVLIPFAGTTLGSACVFFLKGEMSTGIRKTLTGFAAGVMVAASFWSLLNPSLEMAEKLGRLAFVPAAVGFLIGMFFLLVLDLITPHMHLDSTEEGPRSGMRRTTKLILAVTLHNIPEGMAVGVVYASMPLRAEGMSKSRTFLYGMLSGIVEPIASVVTIIASSFITGLLPYFLSFAAGAMMYVVVEELIPEMSEEPHSNLGPIAFAFGFVLMMILDVTLG